MELLPLVVPILGLSLCCTGAMSGILLRRISRLEWRVVQLETVENNRVRLPPYYYAAGPNVWGATATATASVREGDPL